MPLLKINSDGAHIAPEAIDSLYAALRDLPQDAPVMICLHGYKFSPSLSEHDPHDHILALDPGIACRKAVSWPRALGFGSNRTEEGLCIALGWEARGSIWQAYAQARETGEALARLIWACDRPVSLIGHSLGARVALSALPLVPSGSVDRVVLMAAAEFRTTAQIALASEAGQAAEFLNISSRENDLFDLLFECALPPDHGVSRSLGSGLGDRRRNWCDLQIDDENSRAALAILGYDIPAADKKICHWSPYLRSGLFGFYSDFLRKPSQIPLGLLQQILPDALAPRFSRLIPKISVASPLSFSRKASS